jgi:hypothetical protein
MNEMLATGRPTDVSPITQAATQAGEQAFKQQSGQINEAMGAMGLGSSSARTRALAGALSDIGTNIGIEGLRAGVGAQESAAGRSLGALNPYMAGTGQQLAGQQGAISGQIGAGQLGLGAGQLGLGAGQLGLGAGNLMQGGEQIQAQGRLGALSNLTNMGLGLAPIQAGQMNRVPQGIPTPPPAPAPSPMGGGGWGIGATRATGQRSGTRLSPGGMFGGGGFGLQKGGPVVL